jgi:DNA-directed RNA polymerase subunit RPC12/RpoP
MNWSLENMREKFLRFMQGRYGVDDLNKFLLIIAVVFMILSALTNNAIFNGICVLFLIFPYYRMFSKNISKRYSENQIYLKYFNQVKAFFNKEKRNLGQMKTHHIYKCPSCKQKIRVPRGKGKIAIRCQKCGTEFHKRS